MSIVKKRHVALKCIYLCKMLINITYLASPVIERAINHCNLSDDK